MKPRSSHMSKQFRVNGALALVTFLFLPSTAMWAQNSGAIIQGQLVNGSGASVANAMVQWSAVGLAGGATGNSDSQGQFAFEIPIARGGTRVQISVTANSYVPAQTSVQAQAGQTTPVQIVLAPKPRTQFAVVSGTLKDTKSHKAIPAAKISILGAGAVLSATTNAYGAFRIKGAVTIQTSLCTRRRSRYRAFRRRTFHFPSLCLLLQSSSPPRLSIFTPRIAQIMRESLIEARPT